MKQKFHLLLLSVVGVIGIPMESTAQTSGLIQPRQYYGARFEPVNQVLHGAGQSTQAFQEYCKVLDNKTQPLLYMSYTGLKTGNYLKQFDRLSSDLQNFQGQIQLQIGLSMTKDGSPELHYENEVAEGRYDTQIAEFIDFMGAFKGPVFLRIGYEFNGHWNGYEAEAYKKAFVRIENKIRAANVSVATIWCYSPDGKDKDFMNYYPGDKYVDWWSIDLFSASHFTDSSSIAFLDSAHAHHKPVMIGESTPRRVGVLEGQKSWDNWFAPYFNIIHQYPQIKAFCYINWDWSNYPQWIEWGDARIEKNQEVLENYQKEMSRDLYLHRSIID